MKLSENQVKVINSEGHLVVLGGPGSGKTTVAILKAEIIATRHLMPGQKVLFLSFARATVSRVVEAVDQSISMTPTIKKRLYIDTYHSFFWKIIKSHGYLLGLPKKLSILIPHAEAIALSAIRNEYQKTNKLDEQQKKERDLRSHQELLRLAKVEGRVSFGLFAEFALKIVKGSKKISSLISSAYPYIFLDEFQDTVLEQWEIMKALGAKSTIIALADPEQRIFEFVGADPLRIEQFKTHFAAPEFDLSDANFRSAGTEIALFGNHILKGSFQSSGYKGIQIVSFVNNPTQAFYNLKIYTLKAIQRQREGQDPNWSIAVLVPTKKLVRQIVDVFRDGSGSLPEIHHTAVIDVEGAVLSAEVIAFLLQPQNPITAKDTFIELICRYFRGKGGDAPTQKDMGEALKIEAAYKELLDAEISGKKGRANSMVSKMLQTYSRICSLKLEGNPVKDWLLIRTNLERSECPRLQSIAYDARNIRLLERGTDLRELLSLNWRIYGYYHDALEIVKGAFIQEHFSMASKPEKGLIIMNMHKSKGKQFDEVIIFEGWPYGSMSNGRYPNNQDRIVRWNYDDGNLGQARQVLRVAVTRAKKHTTIMTPLIDPCILLK